MVLWRVYYREVLLTLNNEQKKKEAQQWKIFCVLIIIVVSLSIKLHIENIYQNGSIIKT